MKLAILVVYMVQPKSEKILDLHLEYIEKYTDDYMIYASMNKLLPEFQDKLINHPRVKICSFETTQKTGAAEHSYYLEKLAAAAVADGASHLVMLHVDSFPVMPGWAERLAEAATGKCVLATTTLKGVPNKPSACLFFTRAFYLAHGPALLLSEAEQASKELQDFEKEFAVYVPDSGMRYFFKAWQEGCTWHGLERINKQGGSAVYGDMIFHLEKAYIMGGLEGKEIHPLQKRLRGLLNSLKYLVWPFIPKKILYDRFSMKAAVLVKLNEKLIVNSMFTEEREKLFADPQGYIDSLKSYGDRRTN